MGREGERWRPRRAADLENRSPHLLRIFVLIAVAWALVAGIGAAGPAAHLRYVVIITRHGVRSPTWDNARLNQYSAQPWPEWSVPPGYLTPHGRALVQLMGTYYREWLTGEHLLSPAGCADAGRIYIHADTDEHTIETGRALAETLLPGCAVAVHSAPEGSPDPLFDPIEAGTAKPDWEVGAKALRERLGDHPEHFLDSHQAAFEALQFVLTGGGSAPKKLFAAPEEISVRATGKSVRLNEQLSVASTLSENLSLEYAEGMKGKDLGWGRLDADKLLRVLELHEVVLRSNAAYSLSGSGEGFRPSGSCVAIDGASGNRESGAGSSGFSGNSGLDRFGPRYQPGESIQHARPFLAPAGVSAG